MRIDPVQERTMQCNVAKLMRENRTVNSTESLESRMSRIYSRSAVNRVCDVTAIKPIERALRMGVPMNWNCLCWIDETTKATDLGIPLCLPLEFPKHTRWHREMALARFVVHELSWMNCQKFLKIDHGPTWYCSELCCPFGRTTRTARLTKRLITTNQQIMGGKRKEIIVAQQSVICISQKNQTFMQISGKIHASELTNSTIDWRPEESILRIWLACCDHSIIWLTSGTIIGASSSRTGQWLDRRANISPNLFTYFVVQRVAPSSAGRLLVSACAHRKDPVWRFETLINSIIYLYRSFELANILEYFSCTSSPSITIAQRYFHSFRKSNWSMRCSNTTTRNAVCVFFSDPSFSATSNCRHRKQIKCHRYILPNRAIISKLNTVFCNARHIKHSNLQLNPEFSHCSQSKQPPMMNEPDVIEIQYKINIKLPVKFNGRHDLLIEAAVVYLVDGRWCWFDVEVVEVVGAPTKLVPSFQPSPFWLIPPPFLLWRWIEDEVEEEVVKIRVPSTITFRTSRHGRKSFVMTKKTTDPKAIKQSEKQWSSARLNIISHFPND